MIIQFLFIIKTIEFIIKIQFHFISKLDNDIKISNNDSTNNNSTISYNVSSEDSAQTKNSSNYAPITTIFGNNSSDPPIKDIAQKIVIIYGMILLME